MKEALENWYDVRHDIRPRYVVLFYSEIEQKLFNNTSLNKDEIRSLMEPINWIYWYVKLKTKDNFRENLERALLHLRETALITLNEFDNPNIEKIVISLLHDLIEDFNISFKTIKESFWIEIALAVKAISKKKTLTFINSEDLEKIKESWILDENNKLKDEIKTKNDNNQLSESQKIALFIYGLAREKRNKEYFERFKSFDTLKLYIKSLTEKLWIELSDEDLIIITQNTFYVKLADRLHNLRTQWNPNNFEKTKKKIKETKEYFFKIIDKIYPEIKTLFLNEIQKLEEQFDNCSLYNEWVCEKVHIECLKILKN